ncbi:MAG: hypothetical protein ABIQ95_14655 [Bdellovibrionia bacterium]
MSAPKRKFSAALRIFGLVLGVGGAIAGLRFWFSNGEGVQEERLARPIASSAVSLPIPVPSAVPNAPVAKKGGPSSPVAKPTSLVDQKTSKEKWQVFTERFGPDLEPQFNADGQLVSIRGVPGQGVAATDDFKTQDPQKVISRGQEILSAAHDLLGLTADLPLSNPIPRGGPLTAQLYFRETYRGLTVLPEGNLKIDLGLKGEILGLSSNYIPEIKVVSDVRLTSQDAFSKALSSMDEGKLPSIAMTHGNSSSEGNKVVWVTQATQGHVAYQFFIRGHEIVIDAGTGEVLSSRDRRQE